MSLGELVREALRAIRAHTLRSFLTLLGHHHRRGHPGRRGVRDHRPQRLRAGDASSSSPPTSTWSRSSGSSAAATSSWTPSSAANIDWNDYERLSGRSSAGGARWRPTRARSARSVKRRDRRLTDVQVHGTTANFGPLMRLDIAAGRYFTQGEDAGGPGTWRSSAGTSRTSCSRSSIPSAATMLVGGAPYRVIGLLAKQGRTLGQSQDSQVFDPDAGLPAAASATANSLEHRWSRPAAGSTGLEASVDEVRALLRALRHTAFRAPDPFGIVTAESLQHAVAADLGRRLHPLAADRLGVPGRGRHRDHEHHAGGGGRAHAGDRRASGARARASGTSGASSCWRRPCSPLAGGLVGRRAGAPRGLGRAGPARASRPSVTPGIVLRRPRPLGRASGLAAGYWPARSASNLPVVDALRAE